MTNDTILALLLQKAHRRLSAHVGLPLCGIHLDFLLPQCSLATLVILWLRKRHALDLQVLPRKLLLPRAKLHLTKGAQMRIELSASLVSASPCEWLTAGTVISELRVVQFAEVVSSDRIDDHLLLDVQFLVLVCDNISRLRDIRHFLRQLGFLNRMACLLLASRVLATRSRRVAKVFERRRGLLYLSQALLLVDWYEFVKFLRTNDVRLLRENRRLLVVHHMLVTTVIMFEILKIGAILLLDLLDM